MLLLTHLFGFWYVTGSGGHTRAARISSKYRSSPLPSVLWGCVHSVPSAWNAILFLHDQALWPPVLVDPHPPGVILSSSESHRLYFQLCCDSFLPRITVICVLVFFFFSRFYCEQLVEAGSYLSLPWNQWKPDPVVGFL